MLTFSAGANSPEFRHPFVCLRRHFPCQGNHPRPTQFVIIFNPCEAPAPLHCSLFTLTSPKGHRPRPTMSSLPTFADFGQPQGLSLRYAINTNPHESPNIAQIKDSFLITGNCLCRSVIFTALKYLCQSIFSASFLASSAFCFASSALFTASSASR